MQQELFGIPHQTQSDGISRSPRTHRHHGFQHHDPSEHAQSSLPQSPFLVGNSGSAPEDDSTSVNDAGVDPSFVQERLRRLNDAWEEPDTTRPKVPGQRIYEYENALSLTALRQSSGFKVAKSVGTRVDGIHLAHFPNEILTQILSHLHPDSHASVALVSKRFYALITTPHAWRMAFQPRKPQSLRRGQDDLNDVRSETRYFTRLTPHASWRSDLARGKPGTSLAGISSSRNSKSGRKTSAVLTYNTKLPAVVTHIHAVFKSSGKKPPRAIHGASDMGVGSASDPTSGKLEKWGLDELFSFVQLEDLIPQPLPYGVGEGSTVVPNVMDVSQPHGLVGGEGIPGGSVFYRPAGEFRGKYLGRETGIGEAHPDIPRIPELTEAICSVWIAKSSPILSTTQSMVGIMTGSSLGVVTTFALGNDPSGPRYNGGEMSARWVLSPGVPIVALKVDDGYNQKRRALGRVWAVALNALGEIYYLTQSPTAPISKVRARDSVKLAWYAGRSTTWHLVEATRQQARPDESGENAVFSANSSRSSSNNAGTTEDQMIAEAREIERFMRYKPTHFRKACYGWDMRRKLEVDFGGDDGHGAGESILVIDCGLEDNQTSAIRRFCRSITIQAQPDSQESLAETISSPSIFGGGGVKSFVFNSHSSPLVEQVSSSSGKLSPSNTASFAQSNTDDWLQTHFYSKDLGNSQVTTSSIDNSQLALIAAFEEPSKDAASFASDVQTTPTGQSLSDIPGRRARLLGVGTNKGKIVLWNMREPHTGDGLFPVRVIRTESPEISSLALSALHLVHGGSDGLVQAWDPLASATGPIRTINSRSPGRALRHQLSANPTLDTTNHSAAGAIYLDPDPTVLHGMVAVGTFVRHKRRQRHSDIHGRTIGRRYGGGVESYIAAEAEELRDEQQHEAQEKARLRSRFGVGFGSLTEEEALRYAEIISQESFLVDERRRVSISDTGSAADFDGSSTTGSTITPDPSVSGPSPLSNSSNTHIDATDESEFEHQIQTAIRLSLLEGVGEAGKSPRACIIGEYDVPIATKARESTRSSSSSPSRVHPTLVPRAASLNTIATSSAIVVDDDLELALQLSLAEEESRKLSMATRKTEEDEFPALGSAFDKGKGKAV
ncbi:hypothetical protein GGS23DRAFT_609155 [Durotheca rogersii]|uniref:uncharacterized protein n=1 Tax=Durotheca rogersii TaxID=419775 RepID=UPI00221F691F|nr:uncharacterized protein GGS23DRAFT_609155 [Durotheca rogersii]KAI5868435.1 hypothetical protein GGS23DRAFT_609155 [Durotheca rogersii]